MFFYVDVSGLHCVSGLMLCVGSEGEELSTLLPALGRPALSPDQSCAACGVLPAVGHLLGAAHWAQQMCNINLVFAEVGGSTQGNFLHCPSAVTHLVNHSERELCAPALLMRFLLHWNRLGASMLSAGEEAAAVTDAVLFSLSLSISVPLSLSFFDLFILFICFPLSPYLQGLCQKEWEVLKRIAWPSQLLYPCGSWGMSFNRKKTKKWCSVFFWFVLGCFFCCCFVFGIAALQNYLLWSFAPQSSFHLRTPRWA